jgi:hypothetical protein
MRLILTALALVALAGAAEAANRFWVPITVTGAANNGSGACRIQVGAGLATGKVTGETVTVASVTGATGCNVTTTITAIDSTHIDLVGTTFGGAYVSGGTISGGTWNATNIGNWGTSSGTGSGAAIPGTSDAVTFDGSSGGGIVTVAANIGGTNTITGFTWGQWTGTLDFDTNNVPITVTGTGCFTGSGTGARKILMTGATWTCTATTAAASLVTMTTTTNLDAGSDFAATWVLTGSNAFLRGFLGGSQATWGTLQVDANAGAGCVGITGANTFAAISFTGPGCLSFPATTTTTITGGASWTTASGIPIILSNQPGSLATLHLTAAGTAGSNAHPFAFRDITTNTSTMTAVGYDTGDNAGTITITAPTTGSGTHGLIIGGP